MIQFKLMNKETEKEHNTFTFINVPLGKLTTDPNLITLHDILIKFRSTDSKLTGGKKEFIPYNKSILTRILAP